MKGKARLSVVLAAVVVLAGALVVVPSLPADAVGSATAMSDTVTNPIGGQSSQWSYGMTTATTGNLIRFGATLPTGTTASGAKYLALHGVAANYASTPNAVANKIAGDIDIRVNASMANWMTPATNQYLVSKRSTALENYSLGVNTSGQLVFAWSANGSTLLTQTATISSFNSGAGWAANSNHWIRATLVASTGGNHVTDLMTSTDGGVTWSSLIGGAATTAGTTSITTTGTNAVEIGSYNAGASAMLNGSVYYAEVRNGVGGTVAASFDPSLETTMGQTTWTAASGEGWTINRSGSTGADIQVDLTTNSVVGLPAGVTSMRYADGSINYTFASTSVPAGTPISVTASSLINTPTKGTYTSTFTTYNGIGSGTSVDSGTGNPYSIFAAPVTSGSISIADPSARSNTSYQWGFKTATSATLSAVSLGVPGGTTGTNRYLYLPGTGNNFVSTASTALNQVVGTIDMRAQVAPAKWASGASQRFISKWTTTGSQQSYVLGVDSAGDPNFMYSSDGSTQNSLSASSPVSFSDGAVGWVRAVFLPDNGASGNTATFYTSTDGVTWTQDGSSIVTATATSIYAGTAPVTIGAVGTGAFAGKVFYADIRSGVSGTLVDTFDPRLDSTSAPSTWSASTGEVWTVNRSGNSLQADIASDVTVGTVTGLPTGGTASVRLIDSAALYVFTPTSVPANTTASVALSGINNTGTAGSTSVAVATFDNTGPPVGIDMAAVGTATINSDGLTSVGYSSTGLNARGATTVTASGTAHATQTASKLSVGMPAGTGASGPRYLATNAVGSNYASTPATSANEVTASIDIRTEVSVPSWATGSEQRIISRWGTSGNYSYALDVSPTGYLALVYSALGDNQKTLTSTSLIPFTANQIGWLRVAFAPNNSAGGNTATFYTSTDGTTWTQLGSPVVNAGTTQIFGGAAPLTISVPDNYWGGFTGNVYYGAVLQGINGSLATSFDPSYMDPASPSSWTGSTGETWTVTRTAANSADIESVLTPSSITGLPTGGTATYRYIDRAASYFFTPTTLTAGTAVSVTLAGLINTATTGSTSASLTTYDGSGPPVQSVETGTSSAFTIVAGTLTSASVTPSNAYTYAPNATYSVAGTTSSTQSLGSLTGSVPAGSSAAAASRYLALGTSSGNYASTPSTSGNTLTGNMDIRAELAPTTWRKFNSQTIIGKWGASGNWGYKLQIGQNTNLLFCYSTTGSDSTCAASSSKVPFADGTVGYVRAGFVANNGVGGATTTFYTSTDNITWTTLGAAVITTPPATLYSSTAPLVVGYSSGAQSSGNIYWADLRNAANTLVNHFSPANTSATNPSSWTASTTGETWTLTRAGAAPNADVASDLTASGLTNLPSGGVATLRMIDSTLSYNFPATSVAASTPLSFSVAGITNTAAVGATPLNIFTSDSTPQAGTVDSNTAGSLTMSTGNGVAPTSLSQYQADGTTSVGVGGWLTATTGVFAAYDSDPDTADTDTLCVEIQPVTSAFTNTNTACGGVAVSPTGTAGVTVSTLTDGVKYHWHARLLDNNGQYSPWSAFGGNSDVVTAATDIGVDATAPTTGSVYDGTTTSETPVGNGSLASMSGTWTGFADASSGISTYSYAIGTTPGGTDVVNWTSVPSSTTSVTATGLSLRTSQVYYFSVEAVDAVGNTSAVVTSSGQTTGLFLSFSAAASALDLGHFNMLNSFTGSGSTTLTTSTNAHNGYQVYVRALGPPTSASATLINTFTGTWASPASWSGTGFGYTSSDTSVSGSNRFSGGTAYAVVPTSGSGDVVADDVGPVVGTPITNEAFTVGFKATTPPLQAAGGYNATVIFTAVPSF